MKTPVLLVFSDALFSYKTSAVLSSGKKSSRESPVSDHFLSLEWQPYVITSLARLGHLGFTFILVVTEEYQATFLDKQGKGGEHQAFIRFMQGEGISWENIFSMEELLQQALPPFQVATKPDEGWHWVQTAKSFENFASRLALRVPAIPETPCVKKFPPKEAEWQPLPQPPTRYRVDGEEHEKTPFELLAKTGIENLEMPPALAFHGWHDLSEYLATCQRFASTLRQTKETQIAISLNLDGSGQTNIQTGIGFFDHLLDNFARHGAFDLNVFVKGDLHIDEHHTIEDTALALGKTLRQALGGKHGITRYAFSLPMDESAVHCLLDLSGRPYVLWEDELKRERVGDFPTEMAKHFFESLCLTAGFNLNIKIQGENDHHQIEATFKAFARCLRQAVERHGEDIPSTKGGL